MAPGGARADPTIDASRFDNADADHRHVAALFLCHELSPHQPIGGRVDRLSASVALGAAEHDPAHDGCAWVLFTARFDHPDDGADYFTAVAGRKFRPGLVRRDHDYRHGNGADSPARRPQSFCDQEYRARYPFA